MIEWTETTWNPTTGCTKISEGCKYCYAEQWAIMQYKRGINQYSDGFKFKLAINRLQEPLKWKKPKRVFVNSMSDLFHDEMPLNYLKSIFDVMHKTPQHTYQILTKRQEKLNILSSELLWTNNIWLGVSIENVKTFNRIEVLKKVPAKVKFVSFEPLLEDVSSIDLSGIDWIIVGGESGRKARPIEKDWVLNLKNIAEKLNIPFFFKQWGNKQYNPDSADPTLHKSHPLHSRGGCLIDNELFRTYPC